MRRVPTALDRAYADARKVLASHSSSYSLATRLLPRDQRPHVAALYAFARTVDDLVDRPNADPTAALRDFRRAFDDALTARPGSSSDAPDLLVALVDTVDTFEIPLASFDRFFDSMEMDLTITSYTSWTDLLGYMEGSAAAIGAMMLPILEPDRSRHAAALGSARDLGLAFQLTNFLRDIGEDLDRGRQYLPRDDLDRFGVDLEDRSVSPQFVELMQFEIARNRALYDSASAGIAMLPPRSARGIRAARALYLGILDEIERIGYDVFSHRAGISTPKKLSVAARSWRPN